MTKEQSKILGRYLMNYADKVWLEDDEGQTIQEKFIIDWIDEQLKYAKIEENEMYYNSMTSIYYDDMNKDSENTIWLKIRNLFEARISELKPENKR